MKFARLLQQNDLLCSLLISALYTDAAVLAIGISDWHEQT